MGLLKSSGAKVLGVTAVLALTAGAQTLIGAPRLAAMCQHRIHGSDCPCACHAQREGG